MNMQRFYAVVLLGVVVSSIHGMKEVPPKEKQEMDSEMPQRTIPARPFNPPLTFEYKTPEMDCNQSQTAPKALDIDGDSFEAEFSNETIKEAHYMYQFAPALAKQIITHLTDKRGHLLNPEYRVAFFWGPPGCGKTMTAKHIGITLQKEHGWKFLFIPSARTAEDKRNASAKSLNKLFNKLLKDKVNKYYLAFDEINEFFEHTRSEHHDTNMTSKIIRSFFDELLGNPNFFCVGTLNVIDQLEDPSKDRYFESTIRFTPGIIDQIRNDIFRTKVTTVISKLDVAIDDEKLKILLKPVAQGRQLAGIASLCKNLCWLENPEADNLIITEKLITQAVDASVLIRQEGKYGQPQETEREQHERHFKRHEALADLQRTQQADQFREGQEAQAKLAELNFGSQVTIAARSYAQNTQYATGYEANTYINSLYHYYYLMFPQRRPQNYQRLPQSHSEELLQQGKNDSCSIQ